MLRGGGGGHDRRSVFLSSAKSLASNYSVFGEGGSDGTRTKKYRLLLAANGLERRKQHLERGEDKKEA